MQIGPPGALPVTPAQKSTLHMPLPRRPSISALDYAVIHIMCSLGGYPWISGPSLGYRSG